MSAGEGLKIIELAAENIKRLKAIVIRPGEHALVEVKGRNAQGKTSAMDAIWMALEWGSAGKVNPRPIRDGEDKAKVVLDLGQYIVTRTWTENGSYLQVANREGAVYKSPQKILDDLIGSISFDPLAWAQMDAKAQRAALMGLVDLGFDLDELETERKGLYDQRTAVNKTVKTLKARLEGMPVHGDDVPDEEVSAESIMQRMEEANQQSAAYTTAQARVKSQQERLEAAQKEVDEALDRLTKAQAELEVREAALKSMPLPEADSVQQEFSSLNETNRKVREKKAWAEQMQEVRGAEQEAETLTVKLEDIEAKKKSALAAAKFPVDGLGFDEDGVTYNGVPLAQASTAEKLRVSLAVAMALNPKLRVLRITDGSLLDKENLALIEEMAGAKGYQVWCERVADAPDGVGVYIEDGEVVP